jgi:hypothetical protein
MILSIDWVELGRVGYVSTVCLGCHTRRVHEIIHDPVNHNLSSCDPVVVINKERKRDIKGIVGYVNRVR